MRWSEDRVLIVSDDAGQWYVRRVRLVEHDLARDEKVYRCDQPLGGPFPDVHAAVASLGGAGTLPRKAGRLRMPKLGTSCNAGLPVDFVYDAGTHLPTHAAVKGGERRGLCMQKPSSWPSTCNAPDGGLCRDCATQVEKVDGCRGGYRVRALAPVLGRTPFTSEREEHFYDDD